VIERQRLLITCKHIDKLLGDTDETLNATASKGVFSSYVRNITPAQPKTNEDYIPRLRQRLLQVLPSQSLTPESPHISAAHSIVVGLTLVEVAIQELAPCYMREYGPVSEQGAADLYGIMANLQSVSKELYRNVEHSRSRPWNT
jgi:hypothetical protein